jgi:cyclopropane fatty-acyl-phospholipid synthase-like methyltransferase
MRPRIMRVPQSRVNIGTKQPMFRSCLLLFVTIASAGMRADHRSFQAGAEATEQAFAARLEAAEFDEIAALLKISEGSVVADVGAGGGAWTFRLAARVGTSGRAFATEVRRSHVDDIAERARSTGRTNITAILGSQKDVGLPADCCDAMLLRRLPRVR